MNILILSSVNPIKYSGIVAFDLYKGLKRLANTNVKLVVKPYDQYHEKDIIPINGWLQSQYKRFTNKLNKLLHPPANTNRDYYVLESNLTQTYYSSEEILFKSGFTPDIIIVLFMSGFLSFKNLYELHTLTNSPIFLYPMDMDQLTGGCHYALNCQGYHNKCGFCPAYYSNIEYDQSRKNWMFKKYYIDKTDISILCGSEYIYQQALQSSLYEHKKKYKVLLSIDPHIFKPDNMLQSRTRLGLPLDKQILFFGAVNPTEKRKGYQQLIDSLTILKNEINCSNIHIAIAGRNSNSLTSLLPFPYTSLGYLSYNQLALAFQSADIFLCPSLEDSGPMMINQSIMCGTPVIAFKMGIAIDLVITGQTGYLAELRNTDDFAKGIKKILTLNVEERNLIRNQCQKIGIQNCHPIEQANRIYNIIRANQSMLRQ